ncbi:hypothetical protein TW95_gp1337 [Pandoravirus inopinatum]|uniref:Uncharacterized protein n=1 Tax=Pandoravirus inopinatum TaxID=1605721 RepID=A0A0B5JAR5_9VIRU|nr:hypothetical protein TW95_gp1337 [Pandoravirus inopinatum]AJF98071.1 hypothetical protein [Pandoravirus inopinatum]
MVGAHIFFWWLVADNGRPCVAMSQRKNPRAAKNADDADPLANAIYLVFCLNFAYFFLDFSQVCMGRRDASRDRTCVESAAQDREGAPCCARADDATAFCKLGERKKNTTAKYIEKNKFVISLFFFFFGPDHFLAAVRSPLALRAQAQGRRRWGDMRKDNDCNTSAGTSVSCVCQIFPKYDL